MFTFSISLRALRHPLSLLSLVVLLLNDHVLKIAAPSFVTGKLSDFAGLFFFPFLLTAILSLIVDRRYITSRQTAGVSFGITFVWFALIKTSLVVNGLTVGLVQAITSSSAKIVLDPTDLIALISLWPAWQIWSSEESKPRSMLTGKLAYAILGVASLATLATSCSPNISYDRILLIGQRVYIGVADSPGPSEYSEDGGRTWRKVQDDLLESELSQWSPLNYPRIECNEAEPQHCYRVNKIEVVEESQDGGQTWQIAWQVPEGRRLFMERLVNSSITCGKRIDMGPYDLAFLNHNSQSTLIVAMGNEGVLIRNEAGIWDRYRVSGASPTPFENPDEVWVLGNLLLILFQDVTFAVKMGLGVWSLSTLVATLWLSYVSGQLSSAPQNLWAMILPVLASIAIGVGLSVILSLLVGPSAFVVGTVLALVIALIWQWIETTQGVIGQAGWRNLLLAILCLLLAILPFVLWAYGKIALHETATFWAWVTSGAVVMFGIWRTVLVKHSQKSTSVEANT